MSHLCITESPREDPVPAFSKPYHPCPSLTTAELSDCFDMQISHRIHNQRCLQLTAHTEYPTARPSSLPKHHTAAQASHQMTKVPAVFGGSGRCCLQSLDSQHTASPWPPGWHLQKGCTVGVDGRGAAELPAGCCGAPSERRLMQSAINNRQKPGHGHCQISGFYCKP